MFQTFFAFEFRFWLRRLMVYLFLVIITAMILGAVSSDDVVVGVSMENTYRNAPFAIQNFYAIMALITCLMTTAFVNDAASRDFAHQTSQLIFTKPISKLSFLMGRFWGSVCIALIPMLGVSLGVLLAAGMPWNDPERFGPISWAGHFWGLAAFAIPNTIFISAIIFAIAVWLRSTFASFIGVIVLLAFYGISSSLVGGLENETLSQLADPFGFSVFQVQTKYWTLAEKNTLVLTLGNTMLLVNRLIWVGVGLSILAAACWRFSFADRKSKARKVAATLVNSSTAVALPHVDFDYGLVTRIAQLWNQFKVDFFSTVKSPVFLVIVFAGMIDTFSSLRMVANEGFGVSALPVTYSMIDIIRGSLFVYLMAVIVFYSGVLVWKERESKLDEVYDALPHSTWISYTAKLLSILAIIAIVILAEIGMGVLNQAMAGYSRFQLGLYFKELFLITAVWLFCYTVLAFFCHIVSPNKYIGYFLFIGLVIVNAFAWGMFDIESNMVQFASLPSYIYSDMFEFKPYASGLRWFGAYWVVFCILLSCVGVLLWQRGRDHGFWTRLRLAKMRLQGGFALTTLSVFVVWAGIGAYVFYNTQIVNTYQTSETMIAARSQYESELKSYENLPQPRITDVKYDIDIYPERRGLIFRGEQTIVNRHDEPIEKLLINLSDGFETELQVERATLVESKEELDFQVYNFSPPLQPGESVQMSYTVSFMPSGFENTTTQLGVVQNGTFFNNSIAPQIGYQSNFELSNKNDRKRYGLEPNEGMPELNPADLAARTNTYISNSSDWVNVETVIRTSADQIAIAPGSLIDMKNENGRRVYHYKVDHPSLNFYSFVSADFKVAAGKWKGIDVEVYYHPEHGWNVDAMKRSIEKSLDYYTENFGPYKHKQARIIEFPRTSSFAQAFPGTMPYSEGIGFIADIKKEDDIDMVFYVTAHEMAHQWWAHQVIGANMLGATVLSETLAQYSALMVMEKEFGRDTMRKFLKYEMDQYLSSRGTELKKERSLVRVGADQGYIHYRKGSVVMYYLKEMIGEDKVNAALKTLVDRFGYQAAPYPTSVDLVDALREQTPPELHYLLEDLFEKITLFENRTLSTTYKKLAEDKFEVTVEVECRKFQADETGEQTEVPVNDWIEIGAFAKPEPGREYGRTLYRERMKIDQPVSRFTFTVDEVPALAGVDPNGLLVDRLPADNVKPPALVQE